MSASGSPQQSFAVGALAAGASLDVGELVLKSGGTWAVTVRVPEGATLDRVAVRTISGPGGAPAERVGDTWRSRPVVPGEYVVCALLNHEAGAETDVSYLKEIEKLGKQVELTAGAAKTADLVAAAGPATE